MSAVRRARAENGHGADELSIGVVARQAGVSIPTIRYYERLGLIPQAPRTPGGLRRYPGAVLSRLALVKEAKALGLSLKETRELVRATASPDVCRHARRILSVHLARIEEQIGNLRAMRARLRRYQETCSRALVSGSPHVCPTIASMGSQLQERAIIRRS